MRLVWFILATVLFGGLAWFMLNYGPIAGQDLPGWELAGARKYKDPIIAPRSATASTPRFAPPALIVERSALDERDIRLDISAARVFALRGVSLGASVGGREVKRRTVRIWAISETGSNNSFMLTNILRPPLGDAKVASLTALTVSDDKTLVAASAIRLDGDYPVYVFGRANGRIVATIEGLPSPATTLAFSRNGKYLAVGLTKGGLRFYRSSDWAWIAQDAQMPELVRGLDFDAKGRLAATSLDGQVRVYDPSFKTVKKIKAPEGSLPFDIKFSPDGSLLAVGYYDKAAVSVLDAVTLETVRTLSPPRAATPAEWLTNVVWAQSGRAIYAAGGYQSANGEYPILRLPLAEGAAAQSFEKLRLRNMVTGLSPYGVDGVAAAAELFDPDDPDESRGLKFGAFDEAGSILAQRTGEISPLDPGLMAEDANAFRMNADGTVVEIPSSNDRLLRLDLNLRRTISAVAATPDFKPPRQSHPDVSLRNWRGANTPEITFEGESKTLTLDTDERALSYAFAPEDAYVIIGTNLALRKYSFRGVLLQTLPMPGAAQRVSVTPDGKRIVAAFNDGTVRWYDSAEGGELLAVYVVDEDQRWIAWTPTGFYDAGPGADALIGWQVNRGPDREPLFYPARLFADVFYKPGLAADVLKAGKVPPAPPPETLLARLPPVVTIFDVSVVADGVKIEFDVDSPSGRPVTQLIALIDGVRMPVDLTDDSNVRIKPLALNQRLSLTFPIPAGERTTRNVALTAGHDGDILGEATSRGFSVSARSVNPGPRKRPRLLALVVGVSDYQDANIADLRFASADAHAIAQRLRNQMTKFYDVVQVTELTDRTATRSAILSALKTMSAQATPDDVTLAFFAGHGVPDPAAPESENGRRYYFISEDADFTGRKLDTTAVPYTDIVRYVTGAQGRRMVFLDTCYAGLVADPDINGIVNALVPKGVYVAAATNGNSVAFEDSAWQHGAMTSALLSAFDGAARGVTAPGSTDITTERLKPFLRQEIRRLTNDCQDPAILDVNIDEFAFATVAPEGGTGGVDLLPPSTARDCRTGGS